MFYLYARAAHPLCLDQKHLSDTGTHNTQKRIHTHRHAYTHTDTLTHTEAKLCLETNFG